MYNSNSRPYTGSPTKLIVGFNIGTTSTGISYCILERGRVPDILAVTRFPGMEQVRGDARAPSLLYYDQDGNLKAAGYEVLLESTAEVAQIEAWIIAKQWRLHLRPSHLASSLDLDKLPPLPPGKSALDILTDFIKYLFECAKTYIKECHPKLVWSTVEDSIEYTFTHPNGWEEVQQQYRHAVERAGLIPGTPEGQARVYILTEGEAQLHFCVPTLLNKQTTGDVPGGAVIIDTGRGTVDLSMYSMPVNPIPCKEIAPAECRLQGSVFVTWRFKALLKEKLAGWEHFSEEEIAESANEFDKSTMLTIKSDREPVFLNVAGRRYNNYEYNIRFGRLKLTGKEATDLFAPCYYAIVDAFETQLQSVTMPVTTAFFVGGLSMNDWLWSQLELYFKNRSIEICRPDNHIDRAVANGAVLAHVHRENYLVTAQVARATCGFIRTVPVDDKDEQHIQRRNQWQIDVIGNYYVPGYFEKKLLRGTRVNEEMELRESVSHVASSPTAFSMQTVRLAVYRGELSDPKWIDEDEGSFSIFCTISAELHEATQDLVTKEASGGVYYELDYDVIILFGLSELQAYLRWKTKEGERRVPAKISYKPEALYSKSMKERLEELSDDVVDSEDYREVVEYLSTMLLFKPENSVNILIERSRARALRKLWDEALSDADKVIDLDPSSYRGYELRYSPLHGTGRYAEAVEAFDRMLSMLKGSRDADNRIRKYVDLRPVIQSIIEGIVRPIPRVLIDTATGHLHGKRQQAETFKALPIYSELVSSTMITPKLDEARLREAVEEFCRYAMFSHKWGEDEPLFQQVENISIYDLEPSLGNTKLQKFCSLARDHGLRWAWSDTCCIDKVNNVVLQESLVSMFKWYHDSSLTIVHLLGVLSAFRCPGDLRRSIWNSRAWTYQEYVAAKIVLFYTEDWHLYLELEESTSNHKESPAITCEMRQALGVTAPEMAAPRPGLDRVREKLHLASKRETTLEEDAAYSLFGIFNAALPVIYGEGNRAVGRLLDYILTGSGDVSILAWTGTSGSYNSCLPKDLTVYDQVVPPHIPLPMEKAEMDRIIDQLRSSLSDHSILTKLHKRLNKLPSPSIAASRLRLPGITCSITDFVQMSKSYSESGQCCHVYYAETSIFGYVEIKTEEDLTGMEGLCLVHPWIRPLLDQEHSQGGTQLDKTTQALRLVARLRQPFGALLFMPLSRVEYRRAAADSLIMAEVDEEVSLEELTEAIRTIEVQ